MKDVKPEDFRVTENIRLSDVATRSDLKIDDDKSKALLKETRKALGELQDTMYAHNKYAVLICLQGMDTSGKDSLIREVFRQINPRGVVVHSFKVPNELELEHDFLWRHYIALPERGKFAVFNRSHYENVIVTRVHPEYVLKENLPGVDAVEDLSPAFWEMRFKQINNFEKHLAENGTIILKFFLNLGLDEQRERLLRRLEEGKHNWKFSPGDLKERESWKKYQQYYEEAINATSKPNAPWFVVPADDKKLSRYIVAKIILDEMQRYTDIKNPELDEEVKDNIRHYLKVLNSDQ